MVVVVRVELYPRVLERPWGCDALDAGWKLFVDYGHVVLPVLGRLHYGNPEVLSQGQPLELAGYPVGVHHFDDLSVGEQVDLLHDGLVELLLEEHAADEYKFSEVHEGDSGRKGEVD